MGLLEILQQYAAGATGASAPASADTHAHFDQVAAQLPANDLGQGLAAAFRSDATPPFGQMIGSLFSNSNPEQRAGMLNQLINTLGPSASSVAGGVLGRILGNAVTPTVTPQQASQISPGDVTAIANHAEQTNPSIVDRMGAFYAQHPTLVKTLGAVALSAIMGHLQSRR